MKTFLSYKNEDKIYYLSKICYLIKVFDIIQPNVDPRPEDKNMVKNKQNRCQLKLKLTNNTNQI